jgi:signal transduction histidine kinase
MAIVYTGCVTALNLVVTSRLTGQTDARLTDRLTEASRPDRVTQPPKDSDNDDDGDVDDAPLFLWLIEPSGQVIPLGEDIPPLPRGMRPGHGWPLTTSIGGSPFRLDARRTGSRWLAAGQSLAQNRHTEAVLLGTEIAAAPLLLVAMFLGSLAVGLRALGPVEQSRRRQLEFTADASHELRTPLSVISAEADIALAGPRAAAEYQASLARIQGEGKRLRRIVEDLLWLARFDSQPPPPGDEPLDVATIAGTCADRFRVLAQSRSITIEADTETPVPALIIAPPEWIDRLAGVLMDNACRYADSAGRVRVSVTTTAGRAYPKKNRNGCSTGFTARSTTAREPGSGWPSPTRSSGRPEAAGISAARRRWAAHVWKCPGTPISHGTCPRRLAGPGTSECGPADDDQRQPMAVPNSCRHRR